MSGHNIDYVIVGSGLTGAVIARMLHDADYRVVVLERRPHLGGNVHDHTHPSGIRVHTYGPHYFRTNDRAIWDFVNRFGRFYPYEATLQSWVDGRFEHWPIVDDYIKRVVGDSWAPGFQGTPANFEEAALSMMPHQVYEKFVKGYTEKQWGVDAATLNADLSRRFDVRQDQDYRLFRHRYQGIPELGYCVLMQQMLADIPVVLNFDYLQNRELFRPRRMTIFTGPIDEFFDFEFGRLHYRGQQREHIYLPNEEQFQPCGQVNNPSPSNGPHIRTLEWKHMMAPDYAQRIQGTVITRETTISPTDPDHYEYPFPDHANAVLYQRYREHADSLPNVLICGRLGEYRYYDMDQAIARAQVLARRIMMNQ